MGLTKRTSARKQSGAKSFAPYLSFIIYYLLFSVALTSCYRNQVPTTDAWVPTEEQMDSISFYTTHHYTQNYNFLVTADSLRLIAQLPEEAVSGLLVDTVTVYHGDPLVVADIMILPSDTIDSVWVQMARDQSTIAWVHETDLLKACSPDNPISRFIDFFSDIHLLIMLAVIVLAAALLVVRQLYRHNAMIVHLRDIDSFYPTLLCLLVAAAAVFYSTIQVESPDSWRHFYYHPTLNPFAVPLHLEMFLFSVWAILIVTVAALYDIFRQLPTSQALLYTTGLAAVCSLCYIVFSVTTLWHYLVGYPLLLLYAAFALWRYIRFARTPYSCGQCGLPLHERGQCPRCHAINT